jgi:hypothetical protein
MDFDSEKDCGEEAFGYMEVFIPSLVALNPQYMTSVSLKTHYCCRRRFITTI